MLSWCGYCSQKETIQRIFVTATIIADKTFQSKSLGTAALLGRYEQPADAESSQDSQEGVQAVGTVRGLRPFLLCVSISLIFFFFRFDTTGQGGQRSVVSHCQPSSNAAAAICQRGHLRQARGASGGHANRTELASARNQMAAGLQVYCRLSARPHNLCERLCGVCLRRSRGHW